MDSKLFGERLVSGLLMLQQMEALQVYKDSDKQIPLIQKLISDVLVIAEDGVLPDGDSVNIPTLLWAEEWASILNPNAKMKLMNDES